MSSAGRWQPGDPAAGEPDHLPWWARHHARLAVLLACLALAGLGLATSKTNLFSGAGSASANAHTCFPPVPALATVGLDRIVALRSALLRVFGPLARRRYAWGTVSTAVAWTDDSPRPLRLTRVGGDRWPASYEMRVWTRGRDDLGGDVFLFAGERDARVFFDAATMARCHRSATVRTAARPPGARNLTWVNPDGPNQEDVFLLRGRRVYRIAIVLPGPVPGRPASAERELALATVDAVACRLADAGCPESRSRA